MFLTEAVENANSVVQLIVSICTLVGLLGGLIPTIIVLVKKFKEIIKNKNWNAIEQMIQEAMTAVETYSKEHPGMTSDDKLNMAIEAVKAACVSQGIDLDDKLIKDIISEIQKLCKWTKTVNAK